MQELRRRRSSGRIRTGIWGSSALSFDKYFLESSLYSDGLVESTIQALKETGLVYEQDGAIWLRTTEYGDQKDRVMVKGDGSPTYFLPDVAYHMTKWERGFKHVINVQGADHHSTVDRVRAGLQALGLPEGYPEYVLHQMVTVERDGKEVKLSKRAGSYTTLQGARSRGGGRRGPVLLPHAKAGSTSGLRPRHGHGSVGEEPGLQGAICPRENVLHLPEGRDWRRPTSSPDGAALEDLSHPLERELIKRLADFPDTIERAAAARAPHILCDFLEQTAGAVNSWYHAGNPSRNPELAVLVEDPGIRTGPPGLARSVQNRVAKRVGDPGGDGPHTDGPRGGGAG